MREGSNETGDEIVGSDHGGPCRSHWTFAEKTNRKLFMRSKEYQALHMSFTLYMVRVIERTLKLLQYTWNQDRDSEDCKIRLIWFIT